MNPSKIDYVAIGQRLKAYRVAASLSPEEVAKELDISRAALYRLEKGEIIKIDILDRLATLLDTSTVSLLGIDTEYYSSGIGFFERMRQLENSATQIYSHFSPFSFLLTSPDYLAYLRQMLNETDSKAHQQSSDYKQSIDTILAILQERKNEVKSKTPELYNLIGLQHIEHFLHLGVIGSLNLPPNQKMERILAARKEVQYLVNQIEEKGDKLQVAIVEGVMDSTTFQLFYQDNVPTTLAMSPFRLGELPNVTKGIASITSSADAVLLYKKQFEQLWDNGKKGYQAIDLITQTLARS